MNDAEWIRAEKRCRDQEEFKLLADASRESGRAVIDEALITITTLRQQVAQYKADADHKLITALLRIKQGAQEQTAHTGMSWQQVISIIDETLKS